MVATGKTPLVALVTGASVGLGAELAWLFAADGHDVVLVARRRDKLEALAAEIEKKHRVRAIVLAEDLTEPAAPARLVREIENLGVTIEFLVNNAGYGTSGSFAEMDLARELAMIQLNIATLVELTRRLVPAMVARGSGRILNIGSTAGFQPGPFMATYYASKAFVNSFTEALAYELQGTGVTATVSCPGATATEFARVAGTDRSRLFQMPAMSAREVAEHGYHAMMRGRALAVPGLRNKFGLQSLRLAPRAAVRAMAAVLNRSPASKEVQPSPAR
jgi:uncharacterized protein